MVPKFPKAGGEFTFTKACFGKTAAYTCGWFVDMSAIGASIGYFCTCACTLVTIKKDKDGTPFLKIMAVVGLVFSIAFMVLQLISIPGLEGVHFGKESYILLIVWVVLGVIFYIKQRKSLLADN
jgi:amino acid transporter